MISTSETSSHPDGAEYERTVEYLVTQLAPRAPVTTEQIQRDVVVAGKATENQIDVLWDFTDAAGERSRVVFEARSYRRRIDKGRLHAFRSVVDDIQDSDRPVTGVMVTTTGYQRGARSVASTYGLIVLELRSPTDADLQGRVSSIHVSIVMRTPTVENVQFVATEVFDEEAATGVMAMLGDVSISASDGEPQTLDRLLLDGELGDVGGAPIARHDVRRYFDPPAILSLEGRRAAAVRSVRARVGESIGPPVTFTVDGLKSVAWMIRDAVTGARAWIAEDGRTWTTPE